MRSRSGGDIDDIANDVADNMLSSIKGIIAEDIINAAVIELGSVVNVLFVNGVVLDECKHHCFIGVVHVDGHSQIHVVHGAAGKPGQVGHGSAVVQVEPAQSWRCRVHQIRGRGGLVSVPGSCWVGGHDFFGGDVGLGGHEQRRGLRTYKHGRGWRRSHWSGRLDGHVHHKNVCVPLHDVVGVVKVKGWSSSQHRGGSS